MFWTVNELPYWSATDHTLEINSFAFESPLYKNIFLLVLCIFSGFTVHTVS